MNWVQEPSDSIITEYNHVVYFDQLKKHYLAVGESRHTKNIFHIWYCIDGEYQIKKSVVADDLEAAKKVAVQLVKDFVNDHIHYWNSIDHQIRCEI